jgi:hypothetical protein
LTATEPTGEVVRTQANRVLQELHKHEGVVIRFTLSCTDAGVYSAEPCPQQSPLVVAYGGVDDISTVFAGFIYWKVPIVVYGLFQDGLAEVWVAGQ